MLQIVLASVLVALSQETAPPPAPPTPFADGRLLVRRTEYAQAIEHFERHANRGECRGAICDANLAIAHFGLEDRERAVHLAQKAVGRLETHPSLNFWEANELGIILFRAKSRTREQLLDAKKAFQFAREHYTGKGCNIATNLARTLDELDEAADARALEQECEAGVTDSSLTVLRDFKEPVVQRTSPILIAPVEIPMREVIACPGLEVWMRPHATREEVVEFGVTVIGGDRNGKLTYRWTLSDGIIESGQGTALLVVSTATVASDRIDAELQVEGLPSACVTKHSGTAVIRQNP